MTARCHPCPARRTVRACRGIALPFTLIALVVLLLAGVGLIRAMDVGLLQAGNLAFRRDLANQAERGIAQQRNGPIGEFPLTFLGRFTKFENYAPEVEGFR